MRDLYPAVRAAVQELASIEGHTLDTMADAAELVPRTAAGRRFLWLDRYVQSRLWEECGRAADERLASDPGMLDPRPDDLGVLTVEDAPDLPGYYEGFDFHRQPGGIWRDDRGALVYYLGAAVIHVGSTQPYLLHERFVDGLDVEDPPRDVLDLGCGFGKTTFFLAQRFPHATVTGLDPSVPVLRLGRRLATDRGLGVRWRQGVAEAIPLPDASQDLVALTMVLHEMPDDAIVKGLEEVRRVLRPGGTFVALETRETGDPRPRRPRCVAQRDHGRAPHQRLPGAFVRGLRAARGVRRRRGRAVVPARCRARRPHEVGDQLVAPRRTEGLTLDLTTRDHLDPADLEAVAALALNLLAEVTELRARVAVLEGREDDGQADADRVVSRVVGSLSGRPELP